MDPITITVSILSMITLANNVLNTVDRLSKSATSTTRIKTQRIAFRTEIVTMEHWLKNCAMSRSPIESNGEVQKLLEEFHTQTMEVGKLLNVYGFGSGKKESPYKRFASRLKYESGGYEELNEMISLMEKLNKALQTIAPPLPPGYEYAAAGNFSAGRAREAPVRDISEHEEGRLIADDSNHATISSHDDLEAEEHRQSIYDLWHVCCNTFKSMASFGLGHHLALNECHERLKLWGTGLFPNGGLHLDMLVGRSRVLNEKLAVPVASHLVEIALEQLESMDIILHQEHERDLNRLKDAHVQLRTSLLAIDMNRAILEHFIYVSLAEKAEESAPQDTIADHVKYLQGMVAMLFTYLPGMNQLRRSWCLAMETAESPQTSQLDTTATNNKSAAAQESPENQTDDLEKERRQQPVDECVDATFEGVQKLEQYLQGRGPINQNLAARLAKERQRLEYWKYDRAMKMVIVPQEQREIIKMQQQVQEKLQPLLEKSSKLAKPTASQKYASARDEKAALLSEEQIRDLLQCLNSTNTHLINATACT